VDSVTEQRKLNPADFGPILQRIVETKREEVAAARSSVPLDDMRARALDAASPRDFLGATTRPGAVRLIAEIKKASPSKGIIRADFDPLAIARAYAGGGASAISVLTDAPFFQGSIEIFRAVRKASDLPMLRKDFTIDPYQVYEARAIGADAILLITSILSPAQLREFHDLARELGMAALVETHCEADIRRAMSEIRPALLGINNRDLHDPNFHTTLDHTGRMLPIVHQLAGEDVPPPIVSESGIYTNEDVARLGAMGVSTILVGESLMRQDDPEAAVRTLMG
jgi:indole-3-glycerol phosphate synthase